MRKTVFLAAALAAWAGTALAQQKASVRPEDEQAIRLVVDGFGKAFNQADAKAIAALFAADGEIVNERGESVQGREAIERAFAEIFKNDPKARMRIMVDAIRFVGPSMAIEEGSTLTTHAAGRPAERSRYMVVHVKQDGAWRMASAHDLPDETSSAEEELKQLEWLVGDWVDESKDSLVLTTYRWADDHRSILSEFKVQIGGRPAMSGVQRIAWDPLAKTLRSWTFDSQGGFSEGVWARGADNQWVVKMTGVTHQGELASATNTMTRVAKDRMTWTSRDRTMAGQWTPRVVEFSIVRKPPTAMKQEKSQ